jgi:group I intron endonuclease
MQKESFQDKNKKVFYNPIFKQDFNIENNKSGIYCIENITNNKLYIGSSYNIGARWKQHLYALKNNKHHSNYLQNSWNKYGAGNFIFKVLEYCDIDSLLKKEQDYIDFNHSDTIAYGYNLCPVAGSPLGMKHSEETKNKMSKNSTWSKPILQFDINGIFIKEWNSAAEAHDKAGFSQTCIRKVCLGISKQHKNFIWKYKAAPGEEGTSKYKKATEVGTTIINSLEQLKEII